MAFSTGGRMNITIYELKLAMHAFSVATRIKTQHKKYQLTLKEERLLTLFETLEHMKYFDIHYYCYRLKKIHDVLRALPIDNALLSFNEAIEAVLAQENQNLGSHTSLNYTLDLCDALFREVLTLISKNDTNIATLLEDLA